MHYPPPCATSVASAVTFEGGAGKLNARHYTGGREKMEGLHDLYAEYMRPLGLERGRRRSRATHERLEEFYKSIDQPVRLEVDHEQIPDPPKVLITEEARKKYKAKVIRAVLKGLEEPHRVMRDQAMLARDERAHREAAERRAEQAERQAAERVAAAERQAAERVQATERAAAERVEQAERTAVEVLGENDKLRELARVLLGERNQLRVALKELGREKEEVQLRARDYHDRLSDIPLHEVMDKMGYGREQQGTSYVYRDRQGQVALRVEGQKLLDYQSKDICRNSVDLVIHMRRQHQGGEGFTQTQALEFLREEFGDKCPAGAAVAHREQYALELFGRLREERERSPVVERGTVLWRGRQGRAEDHDRSHRDHRSDHRGGGRSSFGGR